MKVLFEDARLLAADKPAGQLTIPGRGPGGPCLREEVEAHLGAKAFIVHRLDREASGLVLFAKDALCHKHLCLEFESRRVRKRYLALVQGEVKEGGVIDEPLRLFGSGRVAVDPRGKPSVTRYEVAERRAGATLLEVFPETGRQHQIRVHLYSIGHPIVGDPLYGKARAEGQRLMLHAAGLEFRDCGGEIRALEAAAPSEFGLLR